MNRKARELECLKTVASCGGLTSFVELTTATLGKMLNMSQQNASRWMSCLIDERLLERRFISGRPHIALTGDGERMLREEYMLLGNLLGDSPRTAPRLRGRLSGGFGEGGYYIGREGYLKQIEMMFSFEPFQGTFNIVVLPEFMNEFEQLSGLPAVLLEGFKADGRSFGEVRCLSGELRSIGNGRRTSCVILQPRRTHHSDTLEILAPISLREFFNAVDGDEFEITVLMHDPEKSGSNGEKKAIIREGALRP